MEYITSEQPLQNYLIEDCGNLIEIHIAIFKNQINATKKRCHKTHTKSMEMRIPVFSEN